jgi:thioredoxin 1
MNFVKAIPNSIGFVDALRYFLEENILVDVFLRSYPLDFELPKDLREKTRCVRIIQVSEDCIIVGPKRPIVTALIPFEEIAAVAISSESVRTDEDEIDRMIEEECPTWERDFATTLESKGGKRMRTERARIIQKLDTSSFWNDVKREKYAVVDIYATWCQPCKGVTAILDELAQNYGNRILFAKLDGDEHEELTEELGVAAYPTVLLLEEGQIKRKIEGARSLEWYTTEIEILLGLRKRGKIQNKTANGKVNVLSSDTLVEYVEDSIASVIMFYKKGDYECELQTRTMRELAPKFKGRVLFAKADVRAEKELAKLFDVEGHPELYFVLDGEVFGYVDDRMTKTELRDAIQELLEEFK